MGLRRTLGKDDLRSRRSNDGNDDEHENAAAGFVFTKNLEQSPHSEPAPPKTRAFTGYVEREK
jgi:hypothetical protein